MLLELKDIVLNQNVSERVQLAKIGDFKHLVYGDFSITLKDLQDMKKNFDGNAKRQEMEGKPVLPFDYSHDDGKKSAGWILSTFIEKDSKGVDSLFGKVEWTPAGAEAIRNKEFKFVSPSYQHDYVDPETNKKFSVVLHGAGLTNVPFLRDMEAIRLFSESKQKLFASLKLPDTGNKLAGVKMTLAEIMEAIRLLSDDEKRNIFKSLAEKIGEKIADGKEMSDLKQELKEAKEKIELSEKNKGGSDSDAEKKLLLSEAGKKELSKEIGELKEKFVTMGKEKDFAVLLSNGKAVEAQRKSYLAGDMAKFAELSVNVKLSEDGSSGNGSDAKGPEDKLIELADKKMEKDKELSTADAMSLVLSENKKLADEYNSL